MQALSNVLSYRTYVVSHDAQKKMWEEGTISHLCLNQRKCSYQELESVFQFHTACQHYTWGSDTGVSDSENHGVLSLHVSVFSFHLMDNTAGISHVQHNALKYVYTHSGSVNPVLLNLPNAVTL